MSDEREKIIRAIQTIYRHGYDKGASDEVMGRHDSTLAPEKYLDTRPGIVRELLALLPGRQRKYENPEEE